MTRMRTIAAGIIALLLASTLGAAEGPAKPAFEPTSKYKRQELRGWPIFVNHRLLEDQKELGCKTLELLGVKLYDIVREVPGTAVQKLQKIPIWVELEDKGWPCMCYHPSKEWLTEHGYNPEKAGGVEIARAATFLEWVHHQPSMVLHELAHGYHDRFLGGYDNPEIAAAYHRAMEKKMYDSVLYFRNVRKRAYAATNAQEYFAELTEAWFGTNDFYPFVRVEVMQHDPEMAGVLKKLWEE